MLLHELEARRDQLITDLCQLHLDELGASLSGDDAGAAEAGERMQTVQRELADVERAIRRRAAEQPTPPTSAPPTAADAAWIDHYTATNAYHALPHNAPDSERRRARERMERTLDALRHAEEQQEQEKRARRARQK